MSNTKCNCLSQNMSLSKIPDKSIVSAESITVSKRKKPQKVLDEDTYTKDLENIIVRDFYPDLPDLKTQAEYYDALKRNDLVKLREFQIKFSGRRPTTGISEASPATFETPIDPQRDGPSLHQDHEAGDDGIAKEDGNKKDPKAVEEDDVKKKGLSLDKYLAKNTSEDNASFAEILKETQAAHREKHAWLYENEQSRTEEENERLALPGIEKQAAIESGPAGVDSWKYKAKNSLMYVPEGADFNAQELLDLQKAKSREIIHENTRFVCSPWNNTKSREMMKQAASAKAIANCGKIGHDGKEVLPTESPMVNGYGFVGTPSPAPGVDESPLMTWGEIESTPFRLEGDVASTPGPQFKIPEVPKRDQLAIELAEKASKAHRDKKEKAIKSMQARFTSPSPKFGKSTTERLNSMSPAAQKLAMSRLGIRTHTDKALKASYTPSPSPSHRLPGEKTPISLTPHFTPNLGGSTPSGSKTPGSKREETDVSSLTDNLLQLPKRKKASDFF